MMIVDKHCSDVCGAEFPMPQIDRQSKHVKRTVTWKTLFTISMEKGYYFNY